jgi:ubiquinone/menaquinone biosynthesis C-methylase UbiE
LKEKAVTAWKQKREVKQRYDITADLYDALHGEEQRAKYKTALENIRFTPQSLVLDAGCGSGLFFPQIADQAEMIAGVDLSRRLLLKALKQTEKIGNADVVLADADHLPFKPGTFNFVFFFTVLQNMPEPKKTLSELKLATKPNGRVVVSALKKAFSLSGFLDMLEAAGLHIESFADEEKLKCYVAVASVLGG